MGGMKETLAQLRDIHLPHPISWWPFAWGWYVVAAVVLFIGVLAIRQALQFFRRRRIRNMTIKKIKMLQTQFSTQAESRILAELSQMLRRMMLHKFPRQQVAGLKGEAWLAFLDETGYTEAFSKGVGKLLLSAPYTSEISPNSAALFPLVIDWVEINL